MSMTKVAKPKEKAYRTLYDLHQVRFLGWKRSGDSLCLHSESPDAGSDQLIVPLGAWQLQMVDQLVDLVAERTLQSNQKTQGSAGAALLSPLRKQTVWEQDPCRLDELT